MGLFTLDDNDDDKVDFNLSLQMGCMETNGTIHTRRRRRRQSGF